MMQHVQHPIIVQVAGAIQLAFLVHWTTRVCCDRSFGSQFKCGLQHTLVIRRAEVQPGLHPPLRAVGHCACATNAFMLPTGTPWSIHRITCCLAGAEGEAARAGEAGGSRGGIQRRQAVSAAGRERGHCKAPGSHHRPAAGLSSNTPYLMYPMPPGHYCCIRGQ